MVSEEKLAKLCPCMSGKPYKECCQPLHQGNMAPDALRLMRSRYSAYALQLADYIIQTTHKENPSYSDNRLKWKEQILGFSSQTAFVGLTILSFEEGPEEAFVTFTAHLKQQGKDATFTERSRFKRAGGKWLYHSGTIFKKTV